MSDKKDKKDKKKDKAVPVITKDDKFYCSECHTELPMRQDCPTCGRVIDWDKI